MKLRGQPMPTGTDDVVSEFIKDQVGETQHMNTDAAVYFPKLVKFAELPVLKRVSNSKRVRFNGCEIVTGMVLNESKVLT